ncbi:MAG: TPM domain-containing protein [Verrucomicrobia bacterium]|nr:TPM domain-containing protein [Verrucomicrobiota bacterium]MBV9642478.1 TPM domain-containing protein [Verrucomicrobiota bacterium]
MAVEVPPEPAHYFNDYASLIDPRTAQQLDGRLQDFERQTSNQILVVIYPSLSANTAIEDFAQEAFRAWKPGQKGRDNGAILFVFVKDRKARIQTGYGLEGALPDAICKRIISDELAPRFRAGDFNGGITAAVNAMIAATQGEYKGTGRTAAQTRAQGQKSQQSMVDLIILLVVLGIVALSWLRAARRGTVYTSSGSRGSGGIWWIGGGGEGRGGFSGGGGDSGFSGGGGDSGGGGASGGW